MKQLTQKGKSLTASATVVQTISNKFTAVVSNVVKWLDESHPMEHYGRHLEFHSFLVCGEAAHTKREKLDSFSDMQWFKLFQTSSQPYIVSNVV